MQDRIFPWSALPGAALIALGIVGVALRFNRRLQRWDGALDRAAAEQATFLTEGLSDRSVGLAIVISAAPSLFLELAMIRWQAAVFPFFAFDQNLSLFSCFAGLGLGYSLGNRIRSHWPYVFLLTSLGIGWWISGSGGLPSTWLGRWGTIVLLTSTLFFSGIVFSTLLKSRGEIAGVMSANLFGAMCGGLLEYNSMYFGFRFLYLLAAGLYLFAFACELLRGKLESAVIAPARI
jgi:hypothetical protein